jgi:hypothetical protein
MFAQWGVGAGRISWSRQSRVLAVSQELAAATASTATTHHHQQQQHQQQLPAPHHSSPSSSADEPTPDGCVQNVPGGVANISEHGRGGGKRVAVWRLNRRHKMLFHQWVLGKLSSHQLLEMSEHELRADPSLATALVGYWS